MIFFEDVQRRKVYEVSDERSIIRKKKDKNNELARRYCLTGDNIL